MTADQDQMLGFRQLAEEVWPQMSDHMEGCGVVLGKPCNCGLLIEAENRRRGVSNPYLAGRLPSPLPEAETSPGRSSDHRPADSVPAGTWGLTSISDDECLADDVEHMRARHKLSLDVERLKVALAAVVSSPAALRQGPRWGDGEEGEAAVRADIDAEEREAVERAWNTGLRGEFIRLVASALPSFDDEGNQASDVAEGMADHFESALIRAAKDWLDE